MFRSSYPTLRWLLRSRANAIGLSESGWQGQSGSAVQLHAAGGARSSCPHFTLDQQGTDYELLSDDSRDKTDLLIRRA